MTVVRHGRRAIVAAAQALAILATGTSLVAAAARISGSDLAGQERQRFVDPPGAWLLQPNKPNMVLPWEARPPAYGCRPGATYGKRHGRKHRRC